MLEGPLSLFRLAREKALVSHACRGAKWVVAEFKFIAGHFTTGNFTAGSYEMIHFKS